MNKTPEMNLLAERITDIPLEDAVSVIHSAQKTLKTNRKKGLAMLNELFRSGRLPDPLWVFLHGAPKRYISVHFSRVCKSNYDPLIIRLLTLCTREEILKCTILGGCEEIPVLGQSIQVSLIDLVML